MRRTLIIALASIAVAGLASCNIVGPAAYFIHGPGNVDAEHKLDPNRSTVLFIDDRGSRIPRRQLRFTIAEEAERNLLDKRRVVDLIDSQAAFAVASNDRHTKPLSIAEIGQAVEAEVVIYATVDTFEVAPTGQELQPIANLRVKVIDAATGERVWPEDRAGYQLPVVMPQQPGAFMASDAGALAKAQRELAVWTGRSLAELFYDVEVTSSTRAQR
ncbi:MAG: hypothetical protein AAGK04_02175 [Planctomycetota bacterium]